MKQTVEEAAKEYAELIVKPQEMYLSFEGVYSLKEDLFNSFPLAQNGSQGNLRG